MRDRIWCYVPPNGHSHPVYEILEYVFYDGLVFEHLVGNARELRYACGDAPAGIDELREPIHYLAVAHFDGANLGDTVILCAEAGRLQIE